jgi:uncharacterized protein (TIGR02246 family)
MMVACSESGSGPGASVPDTRDADIAAVKAAEAAWVKDAATKDVEKFTNYYTDDAVVLLANAPMFDGKEAIKGALKPMLADPNFTIEFHATRAEAAKSGDQVVTVGVYTMTLSGPDKKPVPDKGKYLTVYKKQADGGWKAVFDTFTTDSPAPGAAK